jgi:bifunctional non-homologous end joining protein LigD
LKVSGYDAFDLLWRDGDLRKLPRIERKQALSDLLGENGIEFLIVALINKVDRE